MRYVVIMAGGSGTRLWPLSRKGTPKQLLKIIDGKSLLRLAFERAIRLVPAENILVVTGAAYVAAVAADLPEVSSGNVLGEPVGRDSLNACAWPAGVIATRDPAAVIAQVTADQMIEPVDAFVRALNEAFEIAEQDASALVTLGVLPTSPHTGYGYLQRGPAIPGYGGACEIVSFREKPNVETAARYVAAGDYWWNAGVFVWRAATFLGCLAALEPVTHADVMALVAAPGRLGEIFPTLKKNSVDYAIMEPVAFGKAPGHIVGVPLPVQWRDVGGYASLAEIMPSDEQANAGNARLVSLDAADNIVIDQREPGRLIALLGVHGLIVVETEDALLVASADQAEKIKDLTAVVSTAAPEFA